MDAAYTPIRPFVCAGRGGQLQEGGLWQQAGRLQLYCGGRCAGHPDRQPRLPENKEDWPFLWGENEYNEHVVDIAADYLYLVFTRSTPPSTWRGH